MAEKSNAKEYPKFYYARHMKDGVAGYGHETVLIGDDAIKKMTKSFNGKPVYIFHDERTEEERIETLKETSSGYVTDAFYNELDGWFWCKFMVIDDECHKKINDGWTVSNAYIPTQDKSGGTKHNVPYDRELLDGYFTHLAIVPNPRYEDAKIFTPEQYNAYQDEKRQQLNELKNSNEDTKGLDIMFFKMKKEEVSKVDADTFLEIKNDDGSVSTVKVSEMINAVAEDKKKEEEKANMDDMVEVGNESMTLQELVNKYQELAEKQNACAEDEKENEVEEDEKANESDEDEKENSSEEDKEEKVNHMAELKNAHKTQAATVAKPYLKMDGLALGKAKY